MNFNKESERNKTLIRRKDLVKAACEKIQSGQIEQQLNAEITRHSPYSFIFKELSKYLHQYNLKLQYNVTYKCYMPLEQTLRWCVVIFVIIIIYADNIC